MRWLGPARVALAALWLGLAWLIVAPPAGIMRELAMLLFIALLLTHVAECVMFWRRLKATGGSMPWHIGMTLVFGVLYAAPRMHGLEPRDDR